MDPPLDQKDVAEKANGESKEEPRERSLSQGDMVITLEDLQRPAKDTTTPPQPTDPLQDSFMNDSWGNDCYDNALLPPARKDSLMSKSHASHGSHSTSSRSEHVETTGILKDHGSDPKTSFRNLKRANSSRGLLKRMKHPGMSRSVCSNKSDDFMDYYMALAPTDQRLSRSQPGSPIRTREARASRFDQQQQQLQNDVPPPPTFMVAKSGTPISEWDLTNSSSSLGDEETTPGDLASNLRRGPHLSLHRENLIDSLAWFSFHTPKCVLEDLTSHELVKCEKIFDVQVQGNFETDRQEASKSVSSESDDGSLSSLSDDETKSESNERSVISSRRKHRSEGRRTTEILLSKQLPQNTLKMPYATKQQCALVFVDISGFTKLSTILDEESLSKVRYGQQRY